MKKIVNLAVLVVFLFAGCSHSLAETTVKINPLTPLSELQKLADMGDPAACYELSGRYETGRNGCKKDREKAKEYMEKGAKSDTPTGWTCKGYWLSQYIPLGDSGYNAHAEQSKEVFELYEKSAKGGCPIGQLHLGGYYFSGSRAVGVREDRKIAFEWYKKSAAQGNFEGMEKLATCYRFGWGTDNDGKKAFELYDHLVELGYVEVMEDLASCYNSGCGTDKDEKKAFEIYEYLAEQGNAKIQFAVAICYETGEHDDVPFMTTTPNLSKAAEWYKKIILESGNDSYRGEHATFRLAKIETMAERLPLVPSKITPLTSLSELQKLANSGDPTACYELGRRYRNGHGDCKKDGEKAKFYYQKGAESDTPAGWVCKGCLLLISERKKDAYELFLKAARKGDANGVLLVGYCFDNKDFPSADDNGRLNGRYYWFEEDENPLAQRYLQRANYWYEESAEHGNPIAHIEILYRLEAIIRNMGALSGAFRMQLAQNEANRTGLTQYVELDYLTDVNKLVTKIKEIQKAIKGNGDADAWYIYPY